MPVVHENHAFYATSNLRIVVFAKAPGPNAKTRLASSLTLRQRHLLVEAMLEDTLDALESAFSLHSGDLRRETLCLALSEPGDPFFVSLRERRNVGILAQGPGDLGQKITYVFMQCFRERPSQRVLILGSDSPTLPLASLKRAHEALEASDVVLGPALDGGYYLIGASKLHASLFQEIPWSSERVLDETLNRAARSGLKVSLLPSWFDVDRPADLEWVREGRKPEAAEGEPAPAFRTRALLEGWV